MDEHFVGPAWAALTRRMLPEEQGAAMRIHPNAGCEPGAGEEQFWRLLETTIQPRRQSVPTASSLRLVFDNFTAMPAAVRGVQVRRHCVYNAVAPAGASLELMIERVGGQMGWSVLGQILDSNGEPWRDCAIEMAGWRPEMPLGLVDSARSNAFGEFTFIRSDAGPWRMNVQTGQQQWSLAPLLMP
ncbi:MAG: hypothetical protein ACRD1A_06395 [Terriglobales bacterium]